MKNNKKPLLVVEEKTTLIQKVALITGMICAFLMGIIFISSFFNQLFKPADQVVNGKEAKSTVAVKKYTIPVDKAEFKEKFSIPTEEKLSTLEIKKNYEQDTEVSLKDIKEKIISLSIDAKVTLKDKRSFARVVLIDKDNNEYLVAQGGFPIENITEFIGACEETCVLDPAITPTSLKIEVSYELEKDEETQEFKENKAKPTASINIIGFNYLPQGKSIKSGLTKETVKKSQQEFKIKSLNNKGAIWSAGKTDVSKLTYTEKKKLFIGYKMPNTCGIEFYTGGYFQFCEMAEYQDNQTFQTLSEQINNPAPLSSPNPFSFDWRNRHGQNWMTPVKNQGGCGSCWAFGAVGTVESVINLYYNQHLDKDLSEQDLVSCSGAGNCGGGSPTGALNYIRNVGIVDEACFPYTATNNSCSNKCADWQSRLWRTSGYNTLYSYSSLPEIKKGLLERGPLSMADWTWSHAIVLAGFGEITPGTYYHGGGGSSFTIPEGDPLVGKTYWLIKNSWGTSWGEGGYAKLVYSSGEVGNLTFYSIETPIIPPSGSSYQINCFDNDNDGYCNWGVSNKPATGCPASCNGNNLPDCDDTNITIGTCPEGYVCGNKPWLASGESNISFGDGYFAHGVFSCCGDTSGEYQIGSRCCNNPIKILKQEEVLSVVLNWGVNGSGNGQFRNPAGMAIFNSQIYLADSSNNRIQVFDLNGNYLNQWGVNGSGNGQFIYPYGIAIYNNQVYVTDRNNHRIQVFDLNGNYLNQWGVNGSGNGQFMYPYGIAIFNNQVYVADSSNNRIQVFDLNGNYLSQWGTFGSGNGQFKSPYGIAIDNNNGFIYAVDSINYRVQVFNQNRDFQFAWGSFGSGSGQFNVMHGITIYNNQVYVVDTGNHRIQVFDLNGNYLSQWGSSGQFIAPYEIAIDNSNGYAYITDTSKNRVQVYDYLISDVCRFDPQEVKIKAGLSDPPSEEIGESYGVPLFSTVYFQGIATDYGQPPGTCAGCSYQWSLDSVIVGNSTSYNKIFNENDFGQHQIKLKITDNEGNFNEKIVDIFAGFVSQWGSYGSNNGQFNNPSKIVINNDNGYVYVADSSNHRIQVFDMDGNFQFSWGGYGTTSGKFSTPYDLAIYNNKIYVVEFNNNRVQVFDLNGNYLNMWGSNGTGDGQFNYPKGIAIDNSNGYVYVADTYSNRIQVFDANGVYKYKWGSSGSANGQFQYPEGIAVNNSKVYVTETGGGATNQRVQVFDASNGAFLSKWGYRGSGDGQFITPNGIFVNSSKVYVADTGNHRIQVFNENGTFLYKWGAYGSGVGKFSSPSDVSFYNNYVYVAEKLNNRIQVFAPPSALNRAPVLNPIGNKTVNEGSLLTFTISATDPDGDPLTYSAINLPSGATFSGQTFSWTPNYNQAGTYQVTFRVSDGSLTDEETITITVNNIEQPPNAPSNLTAQALSRTQIRLNWQDNSNNELGFKIERGRKQGQNINFSQITTVGANITTYTDNGLSPNTLYYYRVRAYNDAGNSAYSNTASAKTLK